MWLVPTSLEAGGALPSRGRIDKASPPDLDLIRGAIEPLPSPICLCCREFRVAEL